MTCRKSCSALCNASHAHGIYLEHICACMHDRQLQQACLGIHRAPATWICPGLQVRTCPWATHLYAHWKCERLILPPEVGSYHFG